VWSLQEIGSNMGGVGSKDEQGRGDGRDHRQGGLH